MKLENFSSMSRIPVCLEFSNCSEGKGFTKGFRGGGSNSRGKRTATAAASKAAASYISRQDRRTPRTPIRVRMYFPPCGIRTCTRGRPEQTPRVPEREHSLNIIAQYFYRLRRALSYAPDSQRMLTFLYASIDVCFFIEHPRTNGRFSPPSSCDDTALFPSTGAYIALSLFQYRNELFLISLYKRTSS